MPGFVEIATKSLPDGQNTTKMTSIKAVRQERNGTFRGRMTLGTAWLTYNLMPKNQISLTGSFSSGYFYTWSHPELFSIPSQGTILDTEVNTGIFYIKCSLATGISFVGLTYLRGLEKIQVGAIYSQEWIEQVLFTSNPGSLKGNDLPIRNYRSI